MLIAAAHGVLGHCFRRSGGRDELPEAPGGHELWLCHTEGQPQHCQPGHFCSLCQGHCHGQNVPQGAECASRGRRAVFGLGWQANTMWPFPMRAAMSAHNLLMELQQSCAFLFHAVCFCRQTPVWLLLAGHGGQGGSGHTC